MAAGSYGCVLVIGGVGSSSMGVGEFWSSAMTRHCSIHGTKVVITPRFLCYEKTQETGLLLNTLKNNLRVDANVGCSPRADLARFSFVCVFGAEHAPRWLCHGVTVSEYKSEADSTKSSWQKNAEEATDRRACMSWKAAVSRG